MYIVSIPYSKRQKPHNKKHWHGWIRTKVQTSFSGQCYFLGSHTDSCPFSHFSHVWVAVQASQIEACVARWSEPWGLARNVSQKLFLTLREFFVRGSRTDGTFGLRRCKRVVRESRFNGIKPCFLPTQLLRCLTSVLEIASTKTLVWPHLGPEAKLFVFLFNNITPFVKAARLALNFLLNWIRAAVIFFVRNSFGNIVQKSTSTAACFRPLKHKLTPTHTPTS